jgi:predicted nucleotidyltransferase component of viral defense system
MATRKRSLTPQSHDRLRSILQTATLAALMNSRRWEPGDLAFQGGTSLHLAYGSARFSEDLDFMVRGGLSLTGIAKAVQQQLRLPADIPADLHLAVSASKDERNPHAFAVTLSGPQVLGSVKVKVELWQASAGALKSLRLVVTTLSSPSGQAFVPTLTLPEIFADKVYALGARNRVKARDVFDLWWLSEKEKFEVTESALRTRLAIYPVPSGNLGETARQWLTNAALRLGDLLTPGAAIWVADDLKRWLPSSWPIDDAAAGKMLAVAIKNLTDGLQTMQAIAMEFTAPTSAPPRPPAVKP